MKRCEDEPSEELLQAIDKFNRCDWLGCHEILEQLWSEEKGEVRYFYQALIQVGAALIHWRRENFVGTVGLLERGAVHLREVRPLCQGVDVASLVEGADRMREALLRLGAERMAEIDAELIPKVRIRG